MMRLIKQTGSRQHNALLLAAVLSLACTVLWRVPCPAADDPAPVAAPAPATGTAAQDISSAESVWATGVEYVEAQAHIVEIANDVVYVDAGGAQGIVPGTEITYFETLEIRDLDGKPLGTDISPAGTLTVQHVEQNMSSATITSLKKEPARGMLVKYLTPAAAPAADMVQKTICPEDMQLVTGGSFAYMPGALTRDSFVETQNITENTNAFCMDILPDKKMMSWRDARDYCGAQGKRLCSREEQHKACAQNTRKPACSPEQSKAGTCPRGEAVEDFVSSLEWTGAWSEQDPATQAPTPKTGSCACTGQHPACSTCYYPECRGFEKKFRCCADPE